MCAIHSGWDCFVSFAFKAVKTSFTSPTMCAVVLIFLLQGETPILWPPDVKSQLIRKDPDAEKGRRQEEKGTTEDEVVGWHHQLSGQEFEQAPGKWWKTGKPGVLQSVGSQRVGHYWMTEQQQLQIRISPSRILLWRIHFWCNIDYLETFFIHIETYIFLIPGLLFSDLKFLKVIKFYYWRIFFEKLK